MLKPYKIERIETTVGNYAYDEDVVAPPPARLFFRDDGDFVVVVVVCGA